MNDQDAVSIFVQLNYWDAYRSVVYLTARQFKTFFYIFGTVALLFLLLFTIAWLHPRTQSEWFQMLETSKANLWVLALPLIIVFVLPLISARKLASDDKVRAGFKYVFSDGGIHVESSASKSDFRWAAVQRVVEARSCFLIFINKNVAQNLPKRCFVDGGQIVRFRQLTRAHVADCKLLDQ